MMRLGLLYVGEEDGGIWRFAADPARSDRRRARSTWSARPASPADDVEGLGVPRHWAEKARWLVVSA